MSAFSKHYNIVAGQPILKPKLVQPNGSDFDTLYAEGIESQPYLQKVLKTAKFEMGPPKSRERFKTKAINRDYKSAANNTDYCRAFIYVESPEDIIRLANYFRPCNNRHTLYFEDTFAVPEQTNALRRLQIKFRLLNGHIAEIQVRHAGMKRAFEASHEAYERQAAAIKRFPDPETRPIDVQTFIDRQGRRRSKANEVATRKTPDVESLIHERAFFTVGDMPVMIVNEPFTNQRYAVIPGVVNGVPYYVQDNRYLDKIMDQEASVTESNRESFLALSHKFAQDYSAQPQLKAAA